MIGPSCLAQKREKKQSVQECVEKISAKIGLGDRLGQNIDVKFNYDDPEFVQTELESDSYPGMVTLYKKQIVSGHIISRGPETERLGLPTFEAFSTVHDISEMHYFYEWAPPAEGDLLIESYEQHEGERSQMRAHRAKIQRQRTLFFISFIGSMDDLTLFVPMLAGKGFTTVQLVLGSLLATFTIIGFCIGLGTCKPVADCLMKVPLVAIVGGFAMVLLFKGLILAE